MKLLHITLLALLSMMLTACSGVNTRVDSIDIVNHNPDVILKRDLGNNKSGSAVRISDDWIVTAKHNYESLVANQKISNIHFHPTCDIALIMESGSPINEVSSMRLSRSKTGEKIFTKGYPSRNGLPSMGVGKVMHKQHITKLCQAAVTTAPMRHGMSGGGIFNERDELVGVAQGIFPSSYAKRYKVKALYAFIEICDEQVAPWIEAVTKENLCLN